MDASQILGIIQAYDSLTVKVKELALKQIETRLGANMRLYRNYLQFDSFYLEGNFIHVRYEYYGSYSGSEEVAINVAEINLD